MQCFGRNEGLLIEPVGHLWAAFSGPSGETILLNDESAAILELLESGPSSSDEICSALASDSGLEAESLVDVVEACWPRLIEAGLVRELRPGHATPQ